MPAARVLESCFLASVSCASQGRGVFVSCCCRCEKDLAVKRGKRNVAYALALIPFPFPFFVLIFLVQNGLPSAQNPYIINGDFVDRGKNGTEICLILFGFRKCRIASVILYLTAFVSAHTYPSFLPSPGSRAFFFFSVGLCAAFCFLLS